MVVRGVQRGRQSYWSQWTGNTYQFLIALHVNWSRKYCKKRQIFQINLFQSFENWQMQKDSDNFDECFSFSQVCVEENSL